MLITQEKYDSSYIPTSRRHQYGDEDDEDEVIVAQKKQVEDDGWTVI